MTSFWSCFARSLPCADGPTSPTLPASLRCTSTPSDATLPVPSWLAFNLVQLRLHAYPGEVLIGVFDTSFLPKSGKKTWGLDKFFSSMARAVRTGLEVSIIGVIATLSRRTFALDATQTPTGLSKQAHTPLYGRMDFYLEQLTDVLPKLSQVHYWVGDGGYARGKVFTTLTERGKHLVTKLRPDANAFSSVQDTANVGDVHACMPVRSALPTLRHLHRVLTRSVCCRICRMCGSTRLVSTASTSLGICVWLYCIINATKAIWCSAQPMSSKAPKRLSSITGCGIS